MPYEGDACVVCKGIKSTHENPIIYCDGEDKSNTENEKCNMPVHKRCYNLKEIPEGDWFCQSCLNKIKKKPTNIICCTTKDGALKPTDMPGKYMHIVCGMWNKSVVSKKEPYTIVESELGQHKCMYCSKKQGLCIACEDSSCSVHFHVTCAINKGMLKAFAVVPDEYSPRCSRHQIKSQKKGRRLRAKHIDDTEESEEETEEDSEESDEDADEEESDRDSDDDEEEEEDEEEKMRKEMEEKKKNPMFMAPKKKLALSSNKLIAQNAANMKSLKKDIPAKRHTRFDESSDDDMGTSNNKKPRNMSNPANYRKNPALGISLNNSNPPSNTQQKNDGMSYRERFKKPDTELIPSLLSELKRPSTGNAVASPSAMDDHFRRQQIQQQQAQHTQQLQQQQQQQQQLVQPQPQSQPQLAQLLQQQQSPQQANKNTSIELNRLREEVKKLNGFKQKVAEIFLALNVPVSPSTPSPQIDVEGYVDHLRQTIQRVGPVRDDEMDQIKDYAESLVSKSKPK
ncbi:hypothetical protein EDC96DRAFT_316770 [Choanephora cucurbitarum]|nr:hypothetical protein EDC96DRAFT_316770 [Choanephora cucurbitarum]